MGGTAATGPTSSPAPIQGGDVVTGRANERRMPAEDAVAGRGGAGGTDMAESAAFIGLGGRMGRPMATKRLRRGLDFPGHDIDPDAVAAATLRSGTKSVLNESGRET